MASLSNSLRLDLHDFYHDGLDLCTMSGYKLFPINFLFVKLVHHLLGLGPSAYNL